MSVANATLLDYETAVSHDITVLASSSDGSTASETFTINVINASDHYFVDDGFRQFDKYCARVCSFGHDDPDTGVDTVTYRLLDCTWSLCDRSVADASSLIMRTLLHTVSSFRARVVMAQRHEILLHKHS